LLKNEAETAPPWLTAGFGAYCATRVDPRSPNTAQLKRTAYDLYEQNWTSKANDALGGMGKAEDIRAVGFGILASLAAEQAPSFVTFVREMLAGSEKLDEVLQNIFAVNREQFLAGTGEFVLNQYGPAR
jgi:hypothetical protein